jgi:hypothetical protein
VEGDDNTVSDSNLEGSLVLMTNAEFEQRYPEIAEGENDLNEHSAKKAAKSKTLKRTSGWTNKSFEELKEEMQLDSDEAEEIDDSSSYRV